MTVRFYANPYADAKGFYFESWDEYEKGTARLAKRGVEEFSIEVIDGERVEAALAEVLLRHELIGPANMEVWFDKIEGLRDDEAASLAWWADFAGGRDVDEGLDKVDCCLRAGEMTLREAVEQYIDDMGGPSALGEQMMSYFDFDQFGHDLRLDGYDTDPDTGEEIEHLAQMSDYELGEEYLDSVGEIDKETAARYFDFEKFERDVDISGDMVEFAFAGRTWVMTTPHEA